MDRILRATGGTVQLKLYDANGALADPSPATPVTAAVVDSAGVAIAGSPFTVTHDSAGLYHFTLPVALTILDTYQVTWNLADSTVRYTEFELVGGFLFSLAEFRARDPILTDAATYTPDIIRAIRTEVEHRFEKLAHIAFVPRGRRYTTDGDNSPVLLLPDIHIRSIVACTVGGVVYDATAIAELAVDPWGTVRHTSRAIFTYTVPRNITVLYEYGLLEPPGPVKDKALQYARYLAVAKPADLDDRATAVSTDVGIIRFATMRGGSTGFPDIDAVLQLFGHQNVLVR